MTRTVPPEALHEVRAAVATIVDAADALDDELGATRPNVAKIERLRNRIYVELGSLGRAIAPRGSAS